MHWYEEAGLAQRRVFQAADVVPRWRFENSFLERSTALSVIQHLREAHYAGSGRVDRAETSAGHLVSDGPAPMTSRLISIMAAASAPASITPA